MMFSEGSFSSIRLMWELEQAIKHLLCPHTIIRMHTHQAGHKAVEVETTSVIHPKHFWKAMEKILSLL